MITRESTLPEVIHQYPASRHVFDRYGLHGCGGALGPQETVEFFAKVHGVSLDALLSELQNCPSAPAEPVAYVEELGDVLYRRFFRAAIGVILTAGATLGSLMLVLYAVRGTFTSLDLFGFIQAHGNAQMFGWVGLFVMGFACQGLPRFKYVKLWRPEIANVSFVVMLAGLALRTFGGLPIPGNFVLALAGTVLEGLAVALFLTVILRTIASSTTRDVWDAFVYASLTCFALMGILEPVLTYVVFSSPNSDVLIHRVADWMGPYRNLQIFGFAGIMILGIGQRILPTAFGFRAVPAGVSRATFVMLTAGLAIDIASWVAFRATRAPEWAVVSWSGTALYASAALWVIASLRGLGGEGADRSTKFIRAAFGWLIVACLMVLVEPAYTRMLGVHFSHAFHGAIRHAFTVGFISLMILGVSSKVVPILKGVDLTGLPPLWVPFFFINIGNALRVGSQVATDWTPAAYPILGASGVLEVIGLAVWGIHLWRLMGRADPRSPDENAVPNAIHADMTAAKVVEWFPQTLDVFEQFGFKELRNPFLRNTIARRVTLRMACGMKKVDLETFLAALNSAAFRKVNS